jgi:hypothetical protein
MVNEQEQNSGGLNAHFTLPACSHGEGSLGQFLAEKGSFYSGGEGGIRTRSATIRSATCGFYVAKAAIDATVAMAAWPILAHDRD